MRKLGFPCLTIVSGMPPLQQRKNRCLKVARTPTSIQRSRRATKAKPPESALTLNLTRRRLSARAVPTTGEILLISHLTAWKEPCRFAALCSPSPAGLQADRLLLTSLAAAEVTCTRSRYRTWAVCSSYLCATYLYVDGPYRKPPSRLSDKSSYQVV